ncbi:MAG: ThiF family adenylyltransferase, partial [Victivallales bacterium]|nr:ThiF family adenylyltransferase [Victivallales bacterium]
MFSRLELLIGHEALQRLQRAHVLLLGVGGVGSWAAETLVRSAIGHLTIVDFDTVKPININRQLEALHSTLGLPKTEAIAARLRDINPRLELNALNIRLTPESVPE